MGKPIEHAEISVEKFGGDVFDYLDIHELLDSSQASFADLRHRALTHNSWFVFHVIPKMFGAYLNIVVDGETKRVSTSAVAEQHVMDDLGFMPDAGAYLKLIPWENWMDKKTADADSFQTIKFSNGSSVRLTLAKNVHLPVSYMDVPYSS